MGDCVDYKEIYQRILEEHRQVFETMDMDGMRRFIETIKKYDRIATRYTLWRFLKLGKERV